MEDEIEHGVKGVFLGLHEAYTLREKAKVAILPVPYDKTTSYQHGAERGPEAMIEASRFIELFDIETNSEPYLNGIFTAEPVEIETSERMLNEVYFRVTELLQEGKFVVTLGGEHSITYAPVRAHADH